MSSQNIRLSVHDVNFKESTEVELGELQKSLLSIFDVLESVEARAVISEAIDKTNEDLRVRKSFGSSLLI